MKSTLLALVVAAPLLLLAGCGAETENVRVQYPAAPVGADAEQAATEPEVASSESLNEAAVDESSAGEGDGAGVPAYAQPQSSDVQVGADSSEYADTDPAALTDFHSALDPHGTWADDSTYGTVWTPSSTAVGSDFAPYVTAGHWAYDDDYVWVSDYDWGWAPFHYGRWVYIPGRGWSWIPGRTYAGAWVSWRYPYDGWGYVGWAPIPPTWYWHRGVAVGIGFVPPAPYVFCPTGHLFHPGVGAHIVTGGQVPVVASHTRPYVPASPTVGGHALARPSVGGPAPRTLGVNDAQIVHSSRENNRGLTQARQFARPSTAASLGARAPTVAPARNVFASPRVASGVPVGPGTGSRTIGASPSLGRNAPVVTAPHYRGVAPSPYRAPSAPVYAAPRISTPGYSGPRPGLTGPSYATPRVSPPAMAAPRFTAPTPAAPRVSAPTFSAPTPAAPRVSAPTFSAPRPSGPTMSAPHHMAPSGGFRPSAPSIPHSSGGGFRPGSVHVGGRR